jgi:diguanylate cyclase (GGDEF)-like protein/PAS domain S-box-containing protein
LSQSSSRQLGKILNSIPQVVWTAGRDGKPDFFSDQWSELYGGTPSELLGTGWLRFIHPDDIAKLVSVRAVIAGKAEEWQERLRILHRDGSYRWALIRARPEFAANRKLRRWYGTCVDIHETVVAQEALRESEALYRSVLEASADCIKILDPRGRLLFLNRPGQCSLEIDDPSEFIGSEWINFWPLEAHALVREAITSAQTGKKARFSAYCPTAKGASRWWDVILTPILNECSATDKILAVSRDITSQVAKSEQLRWASEHDALTSLPNRRSFETQLSSSLDAAQQAGKALGLLFLDLDHFKHINDSLGHDAGDLLLKKFTQKLGESVRFNDYVARLGGDEFAIILHDASGTQDLIELGDGIAERLSTPIQLGSQTVSVGASIGGALFPRDGTNARELIKSADLAMYALKAEGRGGTKIFLPEFRAEAQQAASQLNLGRTSVTAETIEPVYQPKVELVSNTIVGYEALLRWRHPTFGLQFPNSVAESFRNFETSTKIGRLMQTAVLRDLAEGGLVLEPGQRVALNASPAEFLRDDYAETLVARMRLYGISGSMLEVEVTEQALAERHASLISRALIKLKSEGIRIALDDFGTGQSSLSHLRDFPVDIIKIDRSFVQRVNADEGVHAIISAILALGRSLKIEVVAEGVETHEQLDLLKSMDCRIGQGFLLGKPQSRVCSGRTSAAA